MHGPGEYPAHGSDFFHYPVGIRAAAFDTDTDLDSDADDILSDERVLNLFYV
jgi:hypothetical protein